MSEVYQLPVHQPRRGLTPLTKQELDVLQAVADGALLKELPNRPQEKSTPYNVAYRFRLKLGAVSNAHAVAIAFREGLIR